MKSKKKLIIPIMLAIVLAALVGYRYVWSRADSDPGTVRLSGNIEVTDAEVSFKIAGRVEQRLVDEGQMVKQGQTVALLDQADLAQDVAINQAQVQAAQAALDELLAGTRPEEIAQAEANMQRAQWALNELLAGSRPEEIKASEATAERARADMEHQKFILDRVNSLHEQKVATNEELRDAQAAYDLAEATHNEAVAKLLLVKEGPRKEQIDQARAALAQAQQAYTQAKNGPRKETIEQARAKLEQARQSLALAQTRLGYATIVSPLTGVVLSKNIEPGEFVSPGTPVVTVGDLVNVWVRAYINETDLGRVKVGQPAKVTTDTYPGKAYQGQVSFIASQAEFTPKNVQTQKERVKLVYRVKIDITNPNMELKPGMPADAAIDVTK